MWGQAILALGDEACLAMPPRRSAGLKGRAVPGVKGAAGSALRC